MAEVSPLIAGIPAAGGSSSASPLTAGVAAKSSGSSLVDSIAPVGKASTPATSAGGKPAATSTPAIPMPKPANTSGAFNGFLNANAFSTSTTSSSTPQVTPAMNPPDNSFLGIVKNTITGIPAASTKVSGAINDALITKPGDLLANSKFMQEAAGGIDQGSMAGSFAETLLQKLSIGLNAVTGLTGGLYQAPDTDPEKASLLDKGLTALTQGLGAAVGIGALGRLATAPKIVGSGVEALTALTNKYPLAAKYIAPYVQPLVENAAGFAIHGQLDPSLAGDLQARGKAFLSAIGSAPLYTALGAVHSPKISLPSSFVLGFGMSKLSGASNQDAVTAGLTFAFLDAAGRAEGPRGMTPEEVQAKMRTEAFKMLQPYAKGKLTENSTTDELKAAYYVAAHATHPDLGGSAQKFTAIKNAYDLLSKGAPAPEAEKSVQLFHSAVKDTLAEHGELATHQGLQDHLGLDETSAQRFVNAAKTPQSDTEIQAAHEKVLEGIRTAETAQSQAAIDQAKASGTAPEQSDLEKVYFNEKIEPALKEGRTVVVDPDAVRQHFGDYSEPNRQVYSKATQGILDRALRESTSKNFTLVGGGSGSGKTEFLTKSFVENNHPSVIYDATQSAPDFVARLVAKAQELGKKPEAYFMISNVNDARYYSLLRAALTGRDVLHDFFVKVHSSYPKSILRLAEEGVPVHAIDARHKNAEQIIQTVEDGGFISDKSLVDLIGKMDYTEDTVRAATKAAELEYETHQEIQKNTSEERAGTLRKSGESAGGDARPEGSPGKVAAQHAFAGFKDLTTTILDQLVGKTTVSRQYIEDLTKQQGIKAAERDLILRVLSEQPETVNVQDFADIVKTELLPLSRSQPEGDASFDGEEEGLRPRYQGVALPSDLRGPIASYSEHVYESPIKTSAGDTHFNDEGFKNYFAHTRVEDLPTPDADRNYLHVLKIDQPNSSFPEEPTRRVIEVQSDLFQKGRLESERGAWQDMLPDENYPAYQKRTGNDRETSNAIRDKELSKLEPYRNTWHERIIREEIRQAAIDGKTKLQFPTGETAMKIEGLGETSRWTHFNHEKVTADSLKVGEEIIQGIHHADHDSATRWVVTDVLGDGKFKAVPKDRADGAFEAGGGGLDRVVNGNRGQTLRDFEESFDISGKVDTSNPIYQFYQKDVAKYLKNYYDAKPVTDAQGVTWNEVPVKSEYADAPVNVFSNGAVKKAPAPQKSKPGKMVSPRGFINPGQAAEDIVRATAKLQDALQHINDVRELTGDVNMGIYQHENARKANRVRWTKVLETAGHLLTAEQWEKLYHYDENQEEILTPEEKAVYDEFIAPTKRTLTDIVSQYRALGGTVTPDLFFMEEGEYTPRFAKDKQGALDKLLEKGKKAIKGFSNGGLLSQSLGTVDKSRKFYAGTDTAGERHTLYIPTDKSANVLEFKDGKISDLGPVKGMKTPKVKEFTDDTVMRKLNDLAAALGIKHDRQPFERWPGSANHAAGYTQRGTDIVHTRLSPSAVLAHELGHQIDFKYGLQEVMKEDVYGDEHKSIILQEMRDLADKRFEDHPVNDTFKKYVRKGSEKMAVMFEAYVHNRELFRQTAPHLYDDFRDFLASHDELKPFLDIQPSLVLGVERHGGVQSGKIGRTFVDAKGKKYTIGQATTREIEQHTSVEYHKNVLANYVVALDRAQNALNAMRLLDRIKNEQEFGEIIKKDSPDEAHPEGWKSVGDVLPQFRGYHMEPRLAEALTDLANRQKGYMHIPVFDEINNLLVGFIVFNPFMHVPNVISGRALAAATGDASTATLKNFAVALHEVVNKGPMYLSYLEHGAPFMALKNTTKNFSDAVFNQYTQEVEENPAEHETIAKILGYANPKHFIEGFKKINEGITWGSNDVFFMHAMLDYRDSHPGMTMEDAIKEVSKRMADYRIPERIFVPGQTGRALSVTMQSRAFMFARFHYSGVIKPWLEAAREGATGTKAERMAGLRGLAYMLVMGLIIWPYLNKMWQGITGSPTTYEGMAGPLRPIEVAENDWNKGLAGLSPAIQSLFTPSPALKQFWEIAMQNRDGFTGNPILGLPPAEGLVGYEMTQIAPLASANRMTPADFALSLFGVWTPKNVDAKNTLNQMKYEEMPALQTQVKKDMAAGNVKKANDEMAEFNTRAIATWNQYELEIGGKNLVTTEAQKQAFLKQYGIKAPGAVALAHANTLYGDGSLTNKSSLIQNVVTYAKAIGVSPTEAFHLIFTGQTISRVQNFGLFNPDSSIIVQRAPVSETSQIKSAKEAAGGDASGEGLQLDHVIPLEGGGTNDIENLNLITTAQDGGQQQQFEDAIGRAVKAGQISQAKVREYAIRYKVGQGETLSPLYMREFTDNYGGKPITFAEVQQAIKDGSAR